MEDNCKEFRKSKIEIKNEFENCKKHNKLDIQTLKNLLSHCNIIPEIIECYLNIIKEEEPNSFLEELYFYYPVLTVEICAKFGVQKKISEKERFFNLISQLSSISYQYSESKLRDFIYKEIKSYVELENIIPKNEKKLLEIKRKEEKQKRENEKKERQKINKKELIDENKKEKKELENDIYCRWFNRYNTAIDYKDEENEEYLFYNLSNSLISEFNKDKKCFKRRIMLINEIIISLEKALAKKKEEKRFGKHFEFLCIALTNCEMDNKKSLGELKPILSSIDREFSIPKFMDINEIKIWLNKNNINYNITNTKISINYNKINFIIDDYTLYNLDENIIKSILNSTRYDYREILESNKKFDEYINNNKYMEGILMKIIKKYSHSELAYSSIEKLFNIDKSEYKELFEELSEKIENYIYILPYNCTFDTERTCKNPMKIIIDPYKQKYKLEIKYLNNDLELDLLLKDFTNLAFRKFAFEHELHLLVTVLLFFLYINEDQTLNSLTKEITDKGEVNIINYIDDNIELNESKKISNEAGNLFELLSYGKVQKQFTLKQLLFIVNEQNDELNYEVFKKNYENYSKKTLINILEEFPENQLFSKYIIKILEILKNKKDDELTNKYLNNVLIVKKDDFNEDNNNTFNLLEDENCFLTSEFERYDNHLYVEKFLKNKK